MLRTEILNPHLLSLLAPVSPTNSLVIADRGFPFWPGIETIDISLTNDVPTVLQVLSILRNSFHAASAYMAREFQDQSNPSVRELFADALKGVSTIYEPHLEFKKRVPGAIGLIRTGDTIPYANVILVSG